MKQNENQNKSISIITNRNNIYSFCLIDFNAAAMKMLRFVVTVRLNIDGWKEFQFLCWEHMHLSSKFGKWQPNHSNIVQVIFFNILPQYAATNVLQYNECL